MLCAQRFSTTKQFPRQFVITFYGKVVILESTGERYLRKPAAGGWFESLLHFATTKN